MALRFEVEKKMTQRERQGIMNYSIDAQKCEMGKVQGRQSLSCVASFTDRSKAMSEYPVWVHSNHYLAQFWVDAPPEKLAAVRASVESTTQSLQIP
jgi:hypothetical protein